MKRYYFPHWFHDPTFTSAQSTEQGTNVNHISSGMYRFFQTRLFKSSGSKYLMRIMQFCNSVLLCKNKRNSHFQSTFWKLFKLFSILESNNWRKNITNVVPWDSVDPEGHNWQKDFYTCEKHFFQRNILSDISTLPVFKFCLKWFAFS